MSRAVRQRLNLLPPPPSAFPQYKPKDFFKFEIVHESKRSKARVGRIHTPHGIIDTPGFVPVGTNAALKGVTQQQADDAGAQLMFANSYHLLLQPGPEVIQDAGGLHKYMNRSKPIITDSGGFQVFSLAYGSVHEELKGANKQGKYKTDASSVIKIDENGVIFKSYRDGRRITLTPEISVQIQKAYGADIIIPFDELPPYHITEEKLEESVMRTHRWEARSLQEHLCDIKNQAMYGVIHGGIDERLRRMSADYITSLPFDGHAIGGSIGKNRQEMLTLLRFLRPLLPDEKPVHLLGIADEPSLHESIPLGIDTFDSCYPTRAGRHGTLFSTTHGSFHITRGKYARLTGPIDEECPCPACTQHSIGYIHHLFKAKEPTAMMLATLHNLTYMVRLMARFLWWLCHFFPFNMFLPSTAPVLLSAAATAFGRRNYLMEDRHQSKTLWGDEEDSDPPPELLPWRMVTPRLKTMDVALVLCLNIGTDPPGTVKPNPCARKECWVEPFSMPAQKALETIGKTLQSQYERWQPRARYRQSLDPTADEIKQLCVSLRRHAKHDRVLFHYNGHGVPLPTSNGEIWVFNKSYTQYIPLLVYELQVWVGTPSIYVFDCSAAGILLQHFRSADALVLAACGANEALPMHPSLCADVFTSCLTTPITVALRWFLSQNEKSMGHLEPSVIDRIPGKLTDRKTPLGELNWIFTAITDTIAWNLFPPPLFQRLFRQDLLVASLFRNFLLAERIMKTQGCTPCSLPALPPTAHHPLWRSWDLAAETCLSQLHTPSPLTTEITFHHSRFFAEQLTAFEVWLQFGSPSKPPPPQLPIILQMLLNQALRLRALCLLTDFFDLGPYAVNLTLNVGIFPYVEKLLQSPAPELRNVLVTIWCKIMALDRSCQVDLVKVEGHVYFLHHLSTPLLPDAQKIQALFVLSGICNGYPSGQQALLPHLAALIPFLTDAGADVRLWAALTLGKAWEYYDNSQSQAIESQFSPPLLALASDPSPSVRAAAVYALGTLTIDLSLALQYTWGFHDASPLVRKEAVLAYARVILHPRNVCMFEHPDSNQIAQAMWQILKDIQAKDPFTALRPLVRMIMGRVPTASLASIPRDNSLPNLHSDNTVMATLRTTHSVDGMASMEQAFVLPTQLQSKLYEWASAVFNKESRSMEDENDPLSEAGQQRLERNRKNTNIRSMAQQLQLGKDDDIRNYNLHLRQSAVFNNESEMTSLLLFHPYDNLLVVADDKDQITLWNVDSSERKCKFPNQNPSGSRLTSLGWINEDHQSLLYCGSDDGVVKIYEKGSANMVLAFKAIPDLIPGTRGSGLIATWQQQAGLLFAGGNSNTLRGWQLDQEMCTIALPTQTEACVTSLNSDEGIGCMAAGFGDGSVRLFDIRGNKSPMVLKEHTSWIVGVHLYQSKYELLTGSVTGELKFWDLRYQRNSVKTFDAHRSSMTALAVHQYAPLYATGSHNQFIKVFRQDGEQLALIRYHEGFLGERIGPVSCLAFHPHRLLLAAGATDSLIAIYSSDK